MKWDTKHALDAARLAQASYLSDSQLETQVDISRWEDFSVIEERNAQALVLTHQDYGSVVSLRGSDERFDWLDNFRVWRRKWPAFLHGAVHAGFLRQARKLCPLIMEEVVDSEQVLVVGHSLGGALVPIVASFLAAQGVFVVGAYSFEAPRTGNRKFAKWYDEKGVQTWRVVNAIGRTVDIVTRVPKSLWGYWHVGKPAILHPMLPRPLHDEASWEMFRRRQPVSSLLSMRVLLHLIRGRKAHGMDLVIKQLERMLRLEKEQESGQGSHPMSSEIPTKL